MGNCKYCENEYQDSERNILKNDLFFANFDNHPVNPGHLKIIPKRHVASICQLTEEEFIALRQILTEAKEMINATYHPDGYNYGINEGEAAGQTVFHLHFHIIPRYKGDVSDPTGGVRNVIPEKGNYKKLKT